MSSTDGRGFHLPDGDAYTNVLRWFLVAVPDKPEYIRAAMHVYTQFTKWYVWERDPLKRGADAADAWDEAVHETLEALEMGFPDILLGHIDEVEDLLKAIRDAQNAPLCCDDFALVDDVIESDIVYNEGTAPGTWGDGEVVADWDDWHQLVCGAAHAWVDQQIAGVDIIETYFTLGLASVSVLLAILTFLSGVGVAIAIAGSSIIAAAAGFLDKLSGVVFANEAAGLEAARDDIVCAIIEGDAEQFEAAVAGAVSSAYFSAVYSFIPWGSVRNLMLEGSHGEQHLGVNRLDTCNCVDPLIDGYVVPPAGSALWVWDGSAYQEWVNPANLNPGGSSLQKPRVNEDMQCKAAASGTTADTVGVGYRDGDTSSAAWVDKSWTFDIPGKNGSSVEYTFLNAAGGVIASGTVTDTAFFPVTQTCSRARFVASAFNRDLFSFYWLQATLNEV